MKTKREDVVASLEATMVTNGVPETVATAKAAEATDLKIRNIADFEVWLESEGVDKTLAASLLPVLEPWWAQCDDEAAAAKAKADAEAKTAADIAAAVVAVKTAAAADTNSWGNYLQAAVVVARRLALVGLVLVLVVGIGLALWVRSVSTTASSAVAKAASLETAVAALEPRISWLEGWRSEAEAAIKVIASKADRSVVERLSEELSGNSRGDKTMGEEIDKISKALGLKADKKEVDRMGRLIRARLKKLEKVVTPPAKVESTPSSSAPSSSASPPIQPPAAQKAGEKKKDPPPPPPARSAPPPPAGGK